MQQQMDKQENIPARKHAFKGNWQLQGCILRLRKRGVLGELPFGLGSIYSVTGDSSQFLAAVILVVNIVGDVFQILHVGPRSGKGSGVDEFTMMTASLQL